MKQLFATFAAALFISQAAAQVPAPPVEDVPAAS